MSAQKAIFISHAWGGISDEILAELTKVLSAENIAFILDKRDLAYRQSINNFMVELGKADMVIIILSNKYLKSEYCMFELIQIYKNDNLRERIFPIVLDEVKISNSADRLDFVKYWETQLIELQNKVKELNSLSYIEGITDDLNLYAEIRNNIARLTGILRDINTLNVTIHVESDYRDLIQSIKKKISGEPEKEENKIYISSTKPPSPVFNRFNYKLAGGSLLIILAFFITWKILSRPKSSDDAIWIDTGNHTVIDSTHKATTFDNKAVKDNSEEMMKQIAKANNGELPPGTVVTRGADYGSKPKEEQTVPKSGPETNQNTLQPTQSNKQSSAPIVKTIDQPVYHEPVKDPGVTQTEFHPQIPEEKTEGKTQVISIPTASEPARTTKALKSFTIVKGTSLQARSSGTISSDDALPVPRRINFVLDQDVYDGRDIAIPAGSSIVGTLSSAKTSENKRAGSVTLFFDYLVAPDGQKIPIQKEEMYLVASGKLPYEIHPNNKIKIKTAASFQIRY